MNIFLGGGVMAGAILRGIIDGGTERDTITVVENREERRRELEAEYAVTTAADLSAVECDGALLVLAVKPQDVPVALTGLAAQPPRLLISICAGITTAQLEAALGDIPVIRTMPNTPALVGCGVTALVKGKYATDEHIAETEAFFAAIGATVVIPLEELMNAVTAVSGSGPAYLFALGRAMEEGAVRVGLSPDTARTLVQQTVLGAAKLWAESGLSPDNLIARVKSKGGTTEAALGVLTERDWTAIMVDAITAAERRGVELAGENK